MGQAAEGGNTDGQFDYALMLNDANKTAEACTWFFKASEHSSTGRLHVCTLLVHGVLSAVCIAMARWCDCIDEPEGQAECVQRAADQGDISSQNNLAATLVAHEPHQAVELWTSAAAAGLKEV